MVRFFVVRNVSAIMLSNFHFLCFCSSFAFSARMFVNYMALLILGFNFIAILLVIYFMISESSLVELPGEIGRKRLMGHGIPGEAKF